MKIKQILNNNAVLVSKGTNELVVLSNGVGFYKKVGQKLSESEIDKVFVLETHDMVEHFSYQLSKTEPNHLLMIEKIIEYAKTTYNLKVTDYIYLTLLDHIDYTLIRYKKGIQFNSPLQWQVKRFYKNEYDVGLMALNLIEEYTSVRLPEEEATSIALHFVNVQSNEKNMQKTAQVTKIIQDIINIVKYEYKMEFDEESFHFARFLTHLHYYAQRILNNEMDVEEENELYLQVKNVYPLAFKCVQKIKLYVYNTYQVNMSENEEVYLIIYIQKVTNRSKGEEGNGL